MASLKSDEKLSTSLSEPGTSCATTSGRVEGNSVPRRRSDILRVTPAEASMICRSAIAELALDRAVVKVESFSCGVVSGTLRCGTLPCEQVTFSLVEIKPGYVVVGDVSAASEMLKKVCWRLKSVNGNFGPALTNLRKGDEMQLESPDWAMERFGRMAAQVSNAKATAAGPLAHDAATSSSVAIDSTTKSGCEAGVIAEASVKESLQRYDVVPAGPKAFRRPAIPRLDLQGLHGVPCRNYRSQTGFFCSEDCDTYRHRTKDTCGLPLGPCAGIWRCF